MMSSNLITPIIPTRGTDCPLLLAAVFSREARYKHTTQRPAFQRRRQARIIFLHPWLNRKQKIFWPYHITDVVFYWKTAKWLPSLLEPGTRSQVISIWKWTGVTPPHSSSTRGSTHWSRFLKVLNRWPRTIHGVLLLRGILFFFPWYNTSCKSVL